MLALLIPLMISQTWHASVTAPILPALPVPDPFLWLDATKIPQVPHGTAISQWDDASGNGNHVTQATGALRPTYFANAQNGLPGVAFNNLSGQFLNRTSLTGISGPSAITIVCMAEATLSFPSYQGIVVFSSSGNNISRAQVGGGNSMFNIWSMIVCNGASPASGGVFAAGFYIVTATYNPTLSALELYRSTSLVGSGTQICAEDCDQVHIGAGPPGVVTYSKRILEVICYNRVFTFPERQATWLYGANKWGITT